MTTTNTIRETLGTAIPGISTEDFADVSVGELCEIEGLGVAMLTGESGEYFKVPAGYLANEYHVHRSRVLRPVRG